MIIENYSVEIKSQKPLGVGGQGSVFKGINNQTGEEVAVKIIDLSIPSNRAAFESEFQANTKRRAGLKNVVEILASYQKENIGFIMMKRYDCDLFSYAFEERDTLLPINEVKILFKKICIGVRRLHRDRIAHLDLKPENILLDLKTMEPYICDFGNAFTSATNSKNKRRSRALSVEIPALGYRGTRKYSSPEMILNPFFYDPFKADIYSLGIILYILLCGSYPGYNDDGTINTDSLLDDGIPRDCFDLLKALLTSNPVDRFYIDQIIEHPFLETGSKFRKAKGMVKTFRKSVGF